MKKFLPFLGALVLVACGADDKISANSKEPQTLSANVSASETSAPETSTSETSTPETPITEAQTDGQAIVLDLTKLDTGVARADLANYPYPFALDSLAVQNYAKSYQLTPQEARHAMTLSMASPEALNKVLDLMVGEYLGHSLTDGKAMSLVVYTTDRVEPAEVDYVIADKFGEGLVLPIKIIPASKAPEAPQVDAGQMMERFHSATEK